MSLRTEFEDRLWELEFEKGPMRPNEFQMFSNYWGISAYILGGVLELGKSLLNSNSRTMLPA